MEGVEFGAGKPVVPDQLDEKDPVRPIILDFDKRMKERYGWELTSWQAMAMMQSHSFMMH